MLVTVAHVLIQDHESRVAEFHQLAYHRFFIMLLNDLSNPDPVFDAINYPVLHAFRYTVLTVCFRWCNVVIPTTVLFTTSCVPVEHQGLHTLG